MIKTIKKWLEAINLYTSVKNENEQYAKELETLKHTYDQLEDRYDIALDEIKTANELLEEYEEQVEKLQPGNTKLDHYCKENYTEIPNIAYEDKRTHREKKYSIFLQELVTPDAWEVQNWFRRFKLEGSMKEIAKKVGDKTAKNILWTNDQVLSTTGDYYLLPNETIADGRGDCEDHTFINMSAHEEIGGAWGFLTKNGETFGHAFNCFVQDEQLYILETTGSKAEIVPYEDSDYEIYFIITRNKTYRVKSGVRFGYIAGWD